MRPNGDQEVREDDPAFSVKSDIYALGCQWLVGLIEMTASAD